MADLDKAYGALARDLRGGRTQLDVCRDAAAAGHRLHPTVLSQLEAGKRRWTTDYMRAVADGLGLDADVFVPLTGAASEVERAASQLAEALVRTVKPSEAD